MLAALFYLILTGVLWLVKFTLGGWIGHVLACIDAAMYKPKACRRATFVLGDEQRRPASAGQHAAAGIPCENPPTRP